ncbi:MAG TPA: TonB-dependent receptor [Sphingobium sp.]|uniref:TonB-dependent receptor domain-containing protein n=1 Tax=Sphingobium sp. TaxID=1912891 RepID=UPI002ED2045F
MNARTTQPTGFKTKPLLMTGICGTALMLACSPAQAQTAPAGQEATPDGSPQTAAANSLPTANGPSEADTSVADIVVTGTLLRGVAPTGTNVVALSSADVVASGATSANQILARVPQVTSAFNTVPTLVNGGPGSAVVRPNLRNLPAVGGSTTLVLIDGHRAVNAGILQTSPDPDVVPPALLERVDVVPDGGSSIYGSDAVGGVINFITKSRFNGIETNARYGFADNYYTVDASVTAGKDWGLGSIYAAYAFSKNDAIFGRDRDYYTQVSPSGGFCPPGTVSIARGAATTTYALPNRVAGTSTNCNPYDNASIFPAVERHSFFAGLTQKLSDAVRFEVKAFYTRRETIGATDLTSTGFPSYGQTVTITPANPFYVPIAPDTGSQSVSFSYAGYLDNKQRNRLDEWGVTPSITAELGSGWQLRALGNYGRSVIDASAPSINAAAQAAAIAATTTATALNPYNLSATNPDVLRSIQAVDYGRSKQELINARLILDGALFHIGGGDVRLAAGAEYIEETFAGAYGIIPVGRQDLAPRGSASRRVKSVFGELAIPIVGSENAFGGVESLTLSASARYDSYSDFGDTFNPKFGATYKPVSWITIRGNYGTSFNAPSLADSAGAPDSRVQILPVSPFREATSPFIPDFLRSTLILAGGNPNLKPQKATTWSVGGDVRPTFINGLTLSATYYNIRLKDEIGLAPFYAPAAIFQPAYSNFYKLNPTLAQAQAAAGTLPLDGAASLASLYGGPLGGPYVLFDARRNNLGELRQSGIDFNASYNLPTSFGSVFASAGGTYTLKREVAPIKGQAFINDLQNPGSSRFSLLASVGTKVGGLTATATLSHSAGYNLSTPLISAAFGTQTKVGAFNPVDLFFAYDVAGEGVFKDLSFTLNINNIANEDPPFYNLGTGTTNGTTLGRLVQFGVRKKF